MQHEGYALTSRFELTHWWFRSRRDLFRAQVRLAVSQIKSRRRENLDELSILDYGCGTGFNLTVLSEFGRVTGADVAAESLVEFQKAKDIPLIDLRNDTTPFRGSFDVITALDVLEHIEDDVDGLRRIREFLRSDGQIILTVPAYNWLWGGEDEVSLHKRRYTKSSLMRSCREAGFEIVFLSYFNLSVLPLSTAVIWTKRIVSPKRALRESNLRQSAPWLNRMLYRLTAFENRRVGEEKLVLPAGASLVCRLRCSS